MFCSGCSAQSAPGTKSCHSCGKGSSAATLIAVRIECLCPSVYPFVRTIDKIVVQGDAMYRNALAAVAEFPMQKLCRLMIYQLQLAGPVKL